MIGVLLGLRWLLVALVMLGALPLLVANYQFLLVGLHFRRLHYAQVRAVLPPGRDHHPGLERGGGHRHLGGPADAARLPA